MAEPAPIKDVPEPPEPGDELKILKDQVKEFRTNNITLANQLKEYQTNFDTLQQRLEAVEAEKTVVEAKAKGKETLEDRLKALEESNRLKDEEIQRERTVNKQNRIKSTLIKSLTEHGADPAAADRQSAGRAAGGQGHPARLRSAVTVVPIGRSA